jgi:serine protease Do
MGMNLALFITVILFNQSAFSSKLKTKQEPQASFTELNKFAELDIVKAKNAQTKNIDKSKNFNKSLWREITDAQAKAQSLNIPSWAPLVEKAQPAVVVITTEALVEHPPYEFPGAPGPYRFYMPIPPEKQQGQGSGFFINEEGYIVTNEHVIAGAQKIKVRVGASNREYKAKIIGSDEPLDIALLKIETDENEKITWPYLPLGDSDSLKLGDPIMALGSPLGLHQSVNVGIVSQKDRGGIRPSGRDLYVELVQLQVPINPGNSGGPVLDDSGRVVCMSESILASSQGGVAFGVPVNTIKNIIQQLLAKGFVERAFLGVEPLDLTPKFAKELGLSQHEKGAVLVQVMASSPAEKAQLKPMDVILEIDGKKVNDAFNLRAQTAYKGVGTTVSLKVYRKNIGIKEYKVTLEKRPGQTAQVAKNQDETVASISIESIGLKVADTSLAIRTELNLSAKNPGAMVLEVTRPSSADGSLISGDVIIKIMKNNETILITSAKQLKGIIDNFPKDKTLMMLIKRGSDERFVGLEKR